MKATKFIEIFDNFTSQQHSDLPITEAETTVVEKIIDHYRFCTECSCAFDAQEYDGTWLSIAEKMTNTSEWTCGNKQHPADICVA